MAKRVKMKAWRGWCVVTADGRVPSGSAHCQDFWESICGTGDRKVRVLVTEIPPKAKKNGAKR